MSIFLKAVAAVLLASIATLVLAKQAKDSAILLAIAVCAMILIGAVEYLQPVIDFIKRLADLAQMDSDILSILLKVVGIGMLSEVAVLICKDAGNTTMGKSLQIMATGLILWISIPLLEAFLDLIESVLKV